jgi:hypothetical protein
MLRIATPRKHSQLAGIVANQHAGPLISGSEAALPLPRSLKGDGSQQATKSDALPASTGSQQQLVHRLAYQCKLFRIKYFGDLA